MSFDLLAEPIRRYVRDQRWEALRPIQAAAIGHILASDNHFILASRTASGKTEAAFLPVLSKVDFQEPGVQVLYISPLIALINDQFQRVEQLCRYLDVPVTKWHGEASRTEKKRLLQAPRGVVLITPESIEAMFVNAPYSIHALFSNLKFVIIDEIHSFLGTDRGIQLKSLLSRLAAIAPVPFRVVGLSATIGDYTEAKRFTGDEARTTVLLDRTRKEMRTSFRYFSGEDENGLPLALLKDLYKQTCTSKTLIFPNSRGRAEEIAVKLRKIADRVGGHRFYFSHHSSVDKEVREYVETFAKQNQRQPFCIACTSTLELGIDIGSVDLVVQVDAAHSIASLIQRVGRSGRRGSEASQLLLYATSPWDLLQALACWLLFEQGYIEPVRTATQPYDLVLHQALSIVKETGGCAPGALLQRLAHNAAFTAVEAPHLQAILAELLRIDWLEQVGPELIIGVEGEYTVNSRDFYSVFKTEPALQVVHAGQVVGEIPLSPQVQENENLLLAARIWKIRYVDLPAKKIEVQPAHDGKPPLFFGSGGVVDPAIREKMLQLLLADTHFPELDPASQEALRELRQEFASYALTDTRCQRPVLVQEQHMVLYTFAGTKVNRSLEFLLTALEVPFVHVDSTSSFQLSVKPELLPDLLEQLFLYSQDVDLLLRQALDADDTLLEFSKWGRQLPRLYQVEILKERYYDFLGAQHFLQTMKAVLST